jgi:hypothetical protein
MDGIVKELVNKAGITEAQAQLVIGVIRDFVGQKAPFLTGMVDNLLKTPPASKSDDIDILG